MKRLLTSLLLCSVLLWCPAASPPHVPVAGLASFGASGGGGSNVTNPDNADMLSATASTAPTIAFPGAVSAGSFLILYVRDGADETTTISSVTDSVNGAWTLLEGPIDHPSATQRAWCYYFENSGAGTPTVTVNLSASIATYLAVAEFRGVPTSSVVDAEATTSTHGAGTSFTSNTAAATVAGATISGLITGATVTATPGSGETDVTAESGRAHIMFKTHDASGSISHSATISGSGAATFFNVAIKSN